MLRWGWCRWGAWRVFKQGHTHIHIDKHTLTQDPSIMDPEPQHNGTLNPSIMGP